MARHEPIIEWDRSREWPPRHVTRLRRAVIAAIKQGRFGRDMHAKMRDRGFSEQDMLATVASPRSYIMRFRHWDGVNRAGFWNPQSGWLVIWLPAYGRRDAGMVISCFWHADGVQYMQRYSETYREIFAPGGK